MALPNFLVLGTAKCGTSSLAEYFRQHPEVCFCRVEEPNFFAKEEIWKRGIRYYESLYDHHRGEKAIGEKSWRYSCFDTYPKAWGRIIAMIPNFKAIYIVREPLSRVKSMWRELRDAGQDTIGRDPNYAILNDQLLIETSLYYRQITPIMKHLGAENVLILFYEDFVRDQVEFYRQICSFLHIQEYRPSLGIHMNQSNDQRHDTILVDYLRMGGLAEPLKRITPNIVRQCARAWLKRPIQSVDIKAKTRDKFLQLTREDSKKFLELAGKDTDFWG